MTASAITERPTSLHASRKAHLSVASLLNTNRDSAPVILRAVLALVLFPHGAQHLIGWFGGYGFSGTYQWMTGLGFPGPLAALAIATEFLAPLALAVGVASRLAALGVIGLMLGAVRVHIVNGFFMNWFGALPAGTEGFEYHVLVLAMAAALVVSGAGRWSLDRLLEERWTRPQKGKGAMESDVSPQAVVSRACQ